MELKEKEEPRFYNYEPSNKSLKKYCLPEPNTKKIEKEIIEDYEEEIENALKGNILDQINAKNINTDLKRDLQKKLDVLSKKTDESIIELIKQKIQNNTQSKPKDISATDKDEVNNTLSFNEDAEKNIGHILYNTLNKLDNLDEFDEN